MKRILFLSFLLLFIGTNLQAKKTYSFKFYIEGMEEKTTSYSDDLFKINFSINKNQVYFIITNKLDFPIFIDWEKSTLTTQDGIARRCVHKGILLKDKSNIQAPTVIPPYSSVEESMNPVDYISFNFDFWNGAQWKFYPIVFTTVGKKFGDSSKEEILRQEGSKLTVMLSLIVDEKIIYKTFNLILYDFKKQ